MRDACNRYMQFVYSLYTSFSAFHNCHVIRVIICCHIESLENHSFNTNISTAVHPLCDDHSISISINICGVWEIKTRILVSRRELRIYIHLDQIRVEFLSFIYIYIYIYKHSYILPNYLYIIYQKIYLQRYIAFIGDYQGCPQVRLDQVWY